MLPTINLTSNRNFKIRNFEEDKIATLKTHPGLRYNGKSDDFSSFSGNFFLTSPEGMLIESFEIIILLDKGYPNTFPIVILLDDKIEKSEDFHLSNEGAICFEHCYVCNNLAKRGLRLYDFANYFLPKYFSWALVKKYGKGENLNEWAHKEHGTKQFYETLLDTTEKEIIHRFLERYCSVPKINRNDKCYCGNDKKLKYCHYDSALFLKATPKETIQKDIELFLNNV
jgi:hypothetical protein